MDRDRQTDRQAVSQYLTLVCELGGGDVQLLELLLQLGVVCVQPGVLQLGLVQLPLQLLVVGRQQLVVAQELPVRLVEPWEKMTSVFKPCSLAVGRDVVVLSSPVLLVAEPAALGGSAPVLLLLQVHPHLLLLQDLLLLLQLLPLPQQAVVPAGEHTVLTAE